MVFRFEYYENVVTKHHLNKVNWTQAAMWAFNNKMNEAKGTVASVRMLDDDKVEIVYRYDVRKPWFFAWGRDQLGLFERVTVDREELSVSVDRMDANYWIPEPFLGQRDFFYVEKRDYEAIKEGTRANYRTAFVRHAFWQNKLWVPYTKFATYFSAGSYKRAFARETCPL